MKRVWIAKCFGIAASLIVLTVTPTMQAGDIKGNLWKVDMSKACPATFDNIPPTAADVTFDVFSAADHIDLRFSDVFSGSGPTVEKWLTSGPNPAQSLASADASLSALLSPSIIEFTGSVKVTTGDTFKIEHDDGVILKIGTTVLSSPGPNPPRFDTVSYSGPSGTVPFRLIYGECHDAEARVVITRQ